MDMTKREVAKTLVETDAVGKFAVFRRGQSGTGARFKQLHSAFDSALSAAQEHCAEAVAQGNNDFTFYVVEIKSKMGIEHGKFVAR